MQGLAESDSRASLMDKQTQIRILEEKLKEIKSAKESFLAKFSLLEKDLDNVTRSLAVSTQSRSQMLKSQLQEIGNLKILDWDRQLKLCQEAEKRIKAVDKNVFEAIGAIQDIAVSFFEKIGFIDAGKVEFEMRETALLKKLRNFGSLTVSEPPMEKVKPSLVFGRRGREYGKFMKPWGICCDSTGRILVSDCENDRIQVFNEFGKFLFRFGKTGSKPGEFNSPTGLTIDNKFRVLVSDTNNHRIQVFTFNGSFLHTFGEKGKKPGQFLHPLDVSVNEYIEIAVSDSGNNRIQLFDFYGRFITELGCKTTPELIISPRGVSFRPDNSLLITDSYRNSVFIIGKEYKTVEEFKPGFFHNPQGIACNKEGIIAVADGRKNIQVFDDKGNLCHSFGAYGVNPGEFDGVQGICFQRDGTIAVADVGNDRIQILPFRVSCIPRRERKGGREVRRRRYNKTAVHFPQDPAPSGATFTRVGRRS